MTANASSWHIKPMPDQHATLPLAGTMTLDDYAQCQNGYIPQSETDKWFIYFGDGMLHFHRAATGSCIFQLPLTLVTLNEQDGEHVTAETLIINRDPKQYRTITETYDLELVAWLIDHYLLKRNAPFPHPPRLNQKHSQAHQQHVTGRTTPQSTFINLNDLLNN